MVGARTGAVDFDYLEGFAAGDMAVVLEVLELFRRQAEGWSRTLGPQQADWRDTVHTIKGAARGVGANKLGDVCARAEWKGETELVAVTAALNDVVADITAYEAEKRA